MDLWRDRAYDLDLDSFVGTTPMPGPLLGCSPELRDGWSDQVRVPGGLHEDDIQALGERTSTQHHRPAGRGGTVYDQLQNGAERCRTLKWVSAALQPVLQGCKW